jgi:hypothetical protein
MNNEEKRLLENKDPIVEKLLYELIAQLLEHELKFETEYKKDSIHLVAKSAFLGIHFMKNCLKLTVISENEIKSPRVFKIEKPSSKRFYIDIKVYTLDELNDELILWIKHSYELRS